MAAVVVDPVGRLVELVAARGEKKFGDCAACHKLEAGANNVGPSLHGVFGRKAGEITLDGAVPRPSSEK